MNELTYETRNQHVAAWLVYAGLELNDVSQGPGKSIIFAFEDKRNEGAELCEQFRANGHVTDANALLDAADEVRRRVRRMFAAATKV